MRILQVANVRWFNATAWYALYLARLLQDAGHDSCVAVLPGTETQAKALDWGLDTVALDLNTVNPLRLPGLAAAMARLAARRRFDVIDCHRGEAFVLWGLLKGRLGYSLVRTRGDQRPPRPNPANAWLHCRAADAVVATNSRTAQDLRRAFNLDQSRLRVIIGGVDRTRFAFDPQGRERVRREFGFGPQDLVFGLLGRFDRVKGQKECIQAVARLVHGRKMSRVRLLLIGFETATAEAEVRSWIQDSRAGAFVAVTGLRPDVSACISACDVGVAPSLWSETIARAALEMMACERPMAGSDVGVMPDLLGPEALVRPGDAAALADLLERALDEPWQKQRLAEQQARLPGLTGQAFLEQTLALYREIAP